MRRIHIPTGTRFGRLLVLGDATCVSLEAMFRCRCDCGALVDVRSSSLRKGATRSCGCYRKETDRRKLELSAPSFEERFRARFIQGPPNECWPWIGRKDVNGYGHIDTPRRRGEIASRVSYTFHVGPIPNGKIVCHKCDNPPCVNPAHLFIGTHLDNSNDKMRKGRDRKAKGERVGSAKLTADQVALIRGSNDSLRSLARTLGVTYGHVGKIRRGELWT